MTKKKVADKTMSKKEGPIYDKTYDLRCSTRTISEIYTKMSEQKKALVQEMGFGGLAHIPTLNVPHKLLKKLALSFDLFNSSLDTCFGKIKITPKMIKNALGLNDGGDPFLEKIINKEINEEQKGMVESFKKFSLSFLKNSVLQLSMDEEENQLKFKRKFKVIRLSKPSAALSSPFIGFSLGDIDSK